ncbi:MAG: DUF5011 domain-containing protein [Bacteroidetes bacterium]|nr:DUF5011 domain-containing protein [Bacteroidota bacterium]
MERYRILTYFLGIGIAAFILALSSCQETDEVPPIITLNGADTVTNFLNSPYVDPGATAIDETDGNLNDNLFIENNVNENLVGEYSVVYKAVDEAGNVAEPVSRIVYVINSAEDWVDYYNATETQDFGQGVCSYTTFIGIDSTVNQRVVLYGFACQPSYTFFMDIADTIVDMPLQLYQDSLVSFSVQGSGWINDSTIMLDYTRKEGSEKFFWNAIFKR